MPLTGTLRGAGSGGRGTAPVGDLPEAGILAVLRHLAMAGREPESGGRSHAFLIATERWGELHGLQIAWAAADFMQILFGLSAEGPALNNPLDLHARLRLTADEDALLRLLRALRQDLTPLAREALAELGRGRRDPSLAAAGLRLVHLLPPPENLSVYHAVHGGLRHLH